MFGHSGVTRGCNSEHFADSGCAEKPSGTEPELDSAVHCSSVITPVHSQTSIEPSIFNESFH